MSRFRLVVADLDGTLLDPLGRVSPRTRAVAAALRERDIPLVLATSRRYVGTAPVAAALALDGPLVLYDGALIRHYPSGRMLHADPVPAEVAQTAAEIMAAHGLRPIAQYAGADSDPTEHLRITPVLAGVDSYDSDYLARCGSETTDVPLDALCRGLPDPLRLVAFGPLARLRRAAQSIAALPCGWQLLPIGNYGTSELSVFAATAAKALAVAWLARRQGISMEQVMAIGDGINDVTLLASVGFGVAMGNGGERTRAAAKAIAPPNDADGAAWAINTYVLDGQPPELRESRERSSASTESPPE